MPRGKVTEARTGTLVIISKFQQFHQISSATKDCLSTPQPTTTLPMPLPPQKGSKKAGSKDRYSRQADSSTPHSSDCTVY